MLGIYVADLNADYIDMPFGRGGPATPGIPGSNSRTKRMRTSFKHHQLRTMKSYFAINHNPDAKDLKQLSQKTGLPKRVLQVSFQCADLPACSLRSRGTFQLVHSNLIEWNRVSRCSNFRKIHLWRTLADCSIHFPWSSFVVTISKNFFRNNRCLVFLQT